MAKIIPIAHPVQNAVGLPPDAGDPDGALYALHKKIYPRAVSGWFASWRIALVLLTQLIYYGLPWLTWNDRQAVLFDLAARKFYIFGLIFWPQDFIYLTVLLLIAALSLFLFTAVAGRLWCGYACPQTVYTEIFLWIERTIEGTFTTQQKRDQGPLTAGKLWRKALKHGLWIALALWTGLTLVGYFMPIRDLCAAVAHFAVPPWETFWLLFYSAATYGNAGWLREQVCKYMCPYARFQGAMFDADTLVITYDRNRGDPRGARKRGATHSDLGDCIDCRICVQVCPTGIDIRNGQQYECIGCAACIDGCNQVMDKMGYERGLIRYATLNSLRWHFGWNEMIKRIFRPRVILYTVLLWTIITGTAIVLSWRPALKVDVIRDRATLAREVEDGLIENVYRLQVMNTREVGQRFMVRAAGIEQIGIQGGETPMLVPAATSKMIPIRLRAPAEKTPKGATRIELQIVAVDANGREQPDDFLIKEKAAFFKP